MVSAPQTYAKGLSTKRMGTGALLFNDRNELLIVKPSYKDHWSIPGGVVDTDESPRAACIREVQEEVGMTLTTCDFVCVDYVPVGEKDECLQFIFWGGTIDKKAINSISIDHDEISEYRFATLDDAPALLGGLSRGLVKRLPVCLEAIDKKTGVYLEDGQSNG